MTRRINRHGLSDYIPADVARVVRRECGYGCVVCGLAFAQYEHFDPPFEDATTHSPEGIALLCGACHDKKSRGVWSAEKVALARRDPITFRRGFARDAFDLASPLTLRVGDTSLDNVRSVIRTLEGERWMAIEPPEVAGGPVQVSATFWDEEGLASLVIRENEWRVFRDHWDTDVNGPKITVRRGPRDIVLELVAEPPHGLWVRQLAMRKGDIGVRIEPQGRVTVTRGRGVTILEDCAAQSADCLFLI